MSRFAFLSALFAVVVTTVSGCAPRSLDDDCVGGGCRVDCGSAGACDVDCVGGTCEVACREASCEVDCVASSCEVER